jgi:hypothetical protein
MNATACGCRTQPCSCCVGTQVLTPAEVCNRPGLDAIACRVGTYGQFFETMKARLSTMTVDVVQSDGSTVQTYRPLLGLTTRDPGDFSIALLDSFAVLADVLSFYQERIANEGYLRVATERRSVLELARLVGYALRPGVASTVYLSYTIDDKQTEPVTIPVGARSQSVPAPGETPQSFETGDPLEARATWNTLVPRKTQPQIESDLLQGKQVYLKGTSTQLKVNDPLLIDFGGGQLPAPFQVTTVAADAANDRTLVSFVPWPSPEIPAPALRAASVRAASLADPAPPNATTSTNAAAAALIQQLTLPASIPPRSTLTLARSLGSAFADTADIGTQVVEKLQPALRGTLGSAWARVPRALESRITVYALRAKTSPFGNVAPQKIVQTAPTLRTDEWTHVDMFGDADIAGANEATDTVFLDGAYDKIVPGSWVLIDTSAVDWEGQQFIERTLQGSLVVAKAKVANAGTSRAAYGMTGKSTLLTLADMVGNGTNWYEMNQGPVINLRAATFIADQTFQLIRRSAVYAQSELLALADMPIADDICHGGANFWIQLDGYYGDLKSGRWMIVSGERADVAGVQASELVMLSNVIQDIASPDGTPMSVVTDKAIQPLSEETPHTFIQFAADLGFCYVRDKVAIYANVVKASHGETRNEVLGSSDGSRELQSFTLKQPPLTFVSAPTAAGAASTLHTYVNDIEWHETPSLAWLGAKDRGFATLTDDAGNTSLTFGNGEHGARLPTGLFNVRAVYRNGIGRPGNVGAGQISLLQTRPLGVKAVVNPLRATGGADKESRDLARENAHLSVMPLDRLVSVQDYADFTRRFAGIGKAVAKRTTDGSRQLVYLSIAGVDDVPIDKTSDLYRNLLDALLTLGDADLPLRVEMREFKMLVLSAKIRLALDYVWDVVVAAVRARLLDVFGFGKRALGQWVLLSEVISAIQNINGVAYVDVDALGAIPETILVEGADGTSLRRPSTPNEVLAAVQSIVGGGTAASILRSRAALDRLPTDVAAWPGGSDAGVLRPAELAVFSPAIPDTLILNQIP